WLSRSRDLAPTFPLTTVEGLRAVRKLRRGGLTIAPVSEFISPRSSREELPFSPGMSVVWPCSVRSPSSRSRNRLLARRALADRFHHLARQRKYSPRGDAHRHGRCQR